MRRPIAIAAGLAALAVSGCGGDDGAVRDSRATPALTRQVDVGGRGMYVDCRGRGAPTVLLDAGLGVDAGMTWARVQPGVARFARVCWYDRGGMGRSDPRPGPRTSARMVSELVALLAGAGIRPPYVLAGASLGGLNMQLFAARRPREVAGLVFVDAIHPDLDARIAGVLGPDDERAREIALERNGEGVTFEDLLASDSEVRDAGDLPPVPLVALRHGVSFDPGGKPDPRVERLWTSLQRDLASRSPRGRYVRVPGSHHRIAEDHPQAVVDAIREVVDAARA
jgi:pimeloyl-ACP methyl ester carboxylesterase